MPGAYCKYCDTRCFVLRKLPDDAKMFAGVQLHMATCPLGMEHERLKTGYDSSTATNPAIPIAADTLGAAIARGLMSEISGADPIVNGEEWNCFEAKADGSDISIMLEDENGKTYGARLTVVEVWED